MGTVGMVQSREVTEMTATAINSLAIGEAMRSKALGYAAKTGVAIDSVVVKAANAKEEFSLAPIKLYRAMLETLSDDERDDLPMPGLRWKDPKTGSLNNNPAIAEWKDPSKPDSKPKDIDFYVVWSDNTPEGRVVTEEREWCNRISTENMKLDGIDDKWIAKYSGNPMLVKKRIKYLDRRRTTVRKAYKDTVRLMWAIDMVNELQGAGAEISPTDMADDTVTVYNKANPRGEWKVFSVGAFLKLNIPLANKAGGSYAALVATTERKRDPGGNKSKLKGVNIDGANAIKTTVQADIVGAAFLNFLDRAWSDKNGTDYSLLLKHLTAAGGGQSVHTLASINRILTGILSIDGIAVIAQREEDAAKAA